MLSGQDRGDGCCPVYRIAPFIAGSRVAYQCERFAGVIPGEDVYSPPEPEVTAHNPHGPRKTDGT